MRILKPVVTALFAIAAAIAGLFMVVVVALTGALVVSALRLFGRKTTIRTSWRGRSSVPSRPTGGAIDVVATEVPADRLTR